MKSLIIRARLSLLLAGFFLSLLAEHTKLIKLPLFASILFSLMVGLIILHHHTRSYQLSGEPSLQSAVVTSDTPIDNKIFSEQTLAEYIANYEQLLRLQPTHRDLLLNVALLYQAKLDTKRSEYYWLQAQKQDPNLPLFSNQQLSLVD